MTSNNTTPHPSDNEATKSQTNTIKKTGSRNSNGVKLASLAIIISVVLSGGVATYAYKIHHDYQTDIAALTTQLKAQQTQFSAAMVNQIKTSGDALAEKTKQQLTQQDDSIKGLQTALTKMKRSPDTWLIAEADYLVRMAGRKLTLERDVVTATELMKDANQRIAELNDPSLMALRQAMSNDIAKLQDVPIIDKDGLVLKLSSLEQRIDHFPLANAILPDEKNTGQPTMTNDIRDWKSNLILSLKDFSSKFITVRVRDGDAVPLLSPKQDFYLRENLKTKLETAIRATLDEQQAIYSTSITMVIKWASTYLNTHDAGVKQFIHSLQQIQSAKVQVTYPTQLDSQALMTEVMHQRVRKEIASITASQTTSDTVTQEDQPQ